MTRPRRAPAPLSAGAGPLAVRRVSVCMITYNHARFVAEALDGALAQRTRHQVEIIIGDDASTDGTPGILADYARRFPGRITVVQRTSNVGMMCNFIDIYARCTGDYICMLEGDDRWSSRDKVERQVAFMDAHPDCAVCFHDTRVFHDTGDMPTYRSPGPRFPRLLTSHDLARGNFIQTPSVMYRGGLVRSLPEWFPDVGVGDWPLHLLHAAHGYIAYLPVVMADYRVHATGAWSKQAPAYRLGRWLRTCRYLSRHFAPRLSQQFAQHIAFCHARMKNSIPAGEWSRQGRLLGIGRLRHQSPRIFLAYERQGAADRLRRFGSLRKLYAEVIRFVRGSYR